MKIRNPFFLTFSAAVLSDIVTCRSSGDQPQIDGNSGLFKLSCHIHSCIVDAANMAQRVEGRNIDADPHKFVHIFLFHKSAEIQIFSRISLVHNLIFCEKNHIFRGIKRKMLFFVGINAPQNLQ